MQTRWDRKGERRSFGCFGVNKLITAYFVWILGGGSAAGSWPRICGWDCLLRSPTALRLHTGGKWMRRPRNYMTCICCLLSLFFLPLPSPLLFLKVPRDHSTTYKIMCLFVWVSGKLEGFHRETCDFFFFFKGLSQPVLVNMSAVRVFFFVKMLFVEVTLLN